ncbi:MAG TPA: deoxyhypusine synthase family protein [Acidobacteriota bacterium]|nr:deoxyhypusine synthase family protein [Acidobacteriota bacterium]
MRHMPYESTVPFAIDPNDTVADVLRKMEKISFQGRNLGAALSVWEQMLGDDCTIWLGLSGAMTAGGMRRIVTHLIQNRYIDVLVSTGANLFHDIYESLGRVHYIGSPHEDDVKLRDERMDRVYDTYCDEIEFRWLDSQILAWSKEHFQPDQKYTTREFIHKLGEIVSAGEHEEGMVTAAYKAGIPIFCPAIADSSLGIALASENSRNKVYFTLDLIRDVEETALIFDQSRETGVIYVGGGTPKNFIQQSSVVYGHFDRGHKYALQFTADAPHWGGLSGCTFREAQSWGKIHPKAHMVSVHVDATIALPIVATGVTQACGDIAAKRQKPRFELGRNLSINGKTLADVQYGAAASSAK